jgi:branched-subunit amino acid aminotransferase/4-amino-4-deoxychorismate lyase
MDRLIYYNDAITDSTEIRLAPTIAGVVYGWGVFTNLRVYEGKPFAFDRHWDRLIRHAEKACVAVPAQRDRAEQALAELIRANSLQQGKARLMILKGDAGGWRTEKGRESEFLIFTSPEVQRAIEPLALTLSPYRLLSSSPLAGVKQTAMLENLLAFEEARGRGFTEAVMLNERGEIVSATAGNIFWVEGDELLTPSLSTGCVAGVTRSFIQEIAARVNIYLVEGSYPLQRVLDATEVFVASGLREIAPVASFDFKHYDPMQARVTRNLSREFQKLFGNGRIHG